MQEMEMEQMEVKDENQCAFKIHMSPSITVQAWV